MHCRARSAAAARLRTRARCRFFIGRLLRLVQHSVSSGSVRLCVRTVNFVYARRAAPRYPPACARCGLCSATRVRTTHHHCHLPPPDLLAWSIIAVYLTPLLLPGKSRRAVYSYFARAAFKTPARGTAVWRGEAWRGGAHPNATRFTAPLPAFAFRHLASHYCGWLCHRIVDTRASYHSFLTPPHTHTHTGRFVVPAAAVAHDCYPAY